MTPKPRIALLLLLLLPGMLLYGQSYPKRVDSMMVALTHMKEDTEQVKTLNSIGFDFRNTDFEMSMKFAQRSLALAKKIHYRAGEAKALNTMGLAYSYNSNVDTALTFYQRALDIAKDIHDSEIQAICYNHMGNSYKMKSNLPMAAEFLQRSLRINELMKDNEGISMARMNIATVYNKLGNYDLAVDNYLKALDLIKAGNNRGNMARIYNGLGNTYLSQKNYPQSLRYFAEAVKNFEAMEDDQGMAVAVLNMGNCNFYMHKFQIALSFYEQALAVRTKLKTKMGIGECHLNIGATYYNLGDYPKAREHYDIAYELYKDGAGKSQLSNLYLNMGTLYAHTGELDKAKKFISEGMAMVNEIGNVNELMGTYLETAGVYADMKDYHTAWDLSSKYIRMKDSLFDANTAQTITQLQSTFDLRSKENEIELLSRDRDLRDEKINKQQVFLFSLTLIVLLFILLVIFAYLGYKRSSAANLALSKAYETIEVKNKSISDSLDYAKKIQSAILPLTRDLERVFPSGFGMYSPKDVVSGDFYWFAELGDKFLLAAADCTGHGVPGAFMSMLGSDKLTHAVREMKLTVPAEILSYLNRSIKHTLKQNETDSVLRDGMDIALCCFDFSKKMMEFSGANRPLYHVRDGVLTEYRPTKYPIGGLTSDDQSYENHSIDLKDGDTIYIFTDGFADQFGGPEKKKFMTKRLKQLIIDTSRKPMNEQEKVFVNAFKDWKGELEQVDDILVIGVRV